MPKNRACTKAYLLTVDPYKHPEITHLGYLRSLQRYLYKITPHHFDYKFYVEVGESMNIHAHGVFHIPAGGLSVMGVIMRKLNKKYGKSILSKRRYKPKQERTEEQQYEDVGVGFIAYMETDQEELAKYYDIPVADLAITRANGKRYWEGELVYKLQPLGVLEELQNI